MPEQGTRHAARPFGRRALLGGVLAGGGLTLAACGVRLEDGAPRLPLLPTRPLVPAEPALVSLLTETRELAAAAKGLGTATGLRLAAAHETQAVVLHDALVTRGVPGHTLTATLAGPSPTAARTAAGDLGRREASSLLRTRALSEAPDDLLPTLVALLAHRWAAAVTLGATPPPPPPAPGPWADGTTAAPFLSATWEARYAVQVLAARSTGTTRTRYLDQLAVLDGLALEQERACGPAVPPAYLGGPLPVSPTSRDFVAAQGRATGTQLLTAYGAGLGKATTRARSGAFTSAPSWLGRAALVSANLGVGLTPFPGLH